MKQLSNIDVPFVLMIVSSSPEFDSLVTTACDYT